MVRFATSRSCIFIFMSTSGARANELFVHNRRPIPPSILVAVQLSCKRGALIVRSVRFAFNRFPSTSLWVSFTGTYWTIGWDGRGVHDTRPWSWRWCEDPGPRFFNHPAEFFPQVYSMQRFIADMPPVLVRIFQIFVYSLVILNDNVNVLQIGSHPAYAPLLYCHKCDWTHNYGRNPTLFFSGVGVGCGFGVGWGFGGAARVFVLPLKWI